MIKRVLDLADLRGIRQGKRHAQPIHWTFEGTSLGGGGKPLDLRNLFVRPSSGFAQINGTGESLAKHHVDGTVDLKKAKDELEPFRFPDQSGLAGQVQFKLDTVGDLLKHDQNPQMDASLTGTGLQISNVAEHEIKEDWIEAHAKGNLVFEETVLKSIRGASATIKTANPQTPTMDMNVAGDVVLAPFAVPNFEIRPSKIDLHAVQAEFAAFMPPNKIEFRSGTIALEGKGKVEGDAVVLNSLSVNPHKLTIIQNKKAVLEDYTGTLTMLGEVRQESKDKKATIDAKLSKLSLTLSDQKNILSIEKAGDGDLVFNLQADGSFTGNGKIAIKNADLKKLSDIAQAAGTNPPPAENEPGQIKSGNLAGTIELVRANADQTLVVGDLTASNLTITDPKDSFKNQNVSLSLRANADKTFSLINLGQLDVKSQFMNVLVSDTVIHRPVGSAPVSPLDMIEKARMVMDVPDLKRGYSLVMAFIPQAPDAEPAPKEKLQLRPPPKAPQADIGSERISSGPPRQTARAKVRQNRLKPAAKPADNAAEERRKNRSNPSRSPAGAANGTIVVLRGDNKALKVEVQQLCHRIESQRAAAQVDHNLALNLALLFQPIVGPMRPSR